MCLYAIFILESSYRRSKKLLLTCHFLLRYMAPEYATSGKLSEKADVYSYGVILLELITGRKPVDTSQPLGDESLVEWVRSKLQNGSS